MVDITDIMDMLDWHMSPEIQLEGISLARNIETIIPFIQPLTPKHNKNVWGNCAVIISERSDEEIKPHLPEVLVELSIKVQSKDTLNNEKQIKRI